MSQPPVPPPPGPSDGTDARPPSPYPPYAASSPPPPPPPPPGGAGGYPPPGGAYQPPGGVPPQNMKAVVGLVCGVIGLIMVFCCSLLAVPLGLAATVLGHLAKQEIAGSGGAQSQGSGLAQGAFVTGIIAMVLGGGFFILGLVLNIGTGLADMNGLFG